MIHPEKIEALSEAGSTLVQIAPRWLRVQNAVKYSGIGRSTFYQLLSARKIKSRAIGTIRLVDRESIDSFIEAQAD